MKNALRHLIVPLVLACLLLPAQLYRAADAPRLGNGISQATFERLGGAEEFQRRRAALMRAAPDGAILLFSAAVPREGYRLRQDNDFFYFTGIADHNAALWMDSQTKRSVLFELPQSEREPRVYGLNVLGLPDGAKRFGFDAVQPVASLAAALGAYASRNAALYARLQPRDKVDGARMETAMDDVRRFTNPLDGSQSHEAQQLRLLRERYPQLVLKDITPHIDALRVVKTASEIEILRKNGRISAAGIAAGIAKAGPGVYEYEVEAAAAAVFLCNGAQGNAYPAIVGSGPNANIWHYFRNDRQMQAGDLVVFDYGADLDQLTMDLTRTFPASGRFTDEQRKWYDVDLRAQEAMIAAMRPGVKLDEITEIGRKMFAEAGIANQFRGFPGHYVGLATHDVGGYQEAVLKAGHVLTCEPIIEFPEKNLHIRIEDTVLITPEGHEVLSAGVPKSVTEIEKLVGSARR